MPQASGMTAAQQSAQQNAQARAAIFATGVERLQPLAPIVVTAAQIAANGNVVNVVPQNVGFVRGFLVKVAGTLTNTNTGATGVALTRSEFGISNALANVVFTDTNNQVRHQTMGWHLGLINSAKQPMVMGAAYTPNVPVDYGNNWTVQSGASTVAAAADAAIQFYYYVPLSYGKYDLRGAMWAGITNAVAQLQLTINATPIAAAGADATLAMYGGNTGTWKVGSSVTISVWQDYIDQIPMVNTSAGPQPFLPNQDVNTLYQLNTTTLSGLVAAQDFGVVFANWRTFLSATLVYDNAGTLNVGSDINYFALQTANTSQLWKYGPNEAALLARTTFLADPPKGVYYFDFRSRPIQTQQFGNMQISVNPITVTNSTAAILVGWEYFAQASQVTNAQSLPSS